jgi:mannose-6-phosphate isomerase-like protein (cupin superfamily)
MQILKTETLPAINLNGKVAARIFDGNKHGGGVNVSAFIVNVTDESGPPRHKHPYAEIFIIIEGKVRLEADGEVVEATPDEICIVAADAPHKFTNVGPGPARMVNIHAAADVVTEFVDELPADYEYRVSAHSHSVAHAGAL